MRDQRAEGVKPSDELIALKDIIKTKGNRGHHDRIRCGARALG